jgi:ketosteroid isomerase-like protein
VTQQYDPLTQAEVAQLVKVLCVDFGFCLTVEAARDLETNPPRTVNAFTQAVFTADGQDPAIADERFYTRVESVVAATFERKPIPGRQDTAGMYGSFDEAEIRAAERSMVALLEDPELSKRAYAYTEDAIFCMSGAPVIQGRQEMLSRPNTQMFSVSLKPEATEGHGNLAYVYGRFSCFIGRTASSAGTPVDLRFLMVWRKEADGIWRIAKEFLNPDEAQRKPATTN